MPLNVWNLWEPGSVTYVGLLCIALAGIIDGIGLLFNFSWAQTLGVVLSMLNLVAIPLGTALGLFGLWQLVVKKQVHSP